MTADSAHSCIGCGARVPPQDDDSSLISMKYGWRLTRRQLENGGSVQEWRCPRCWKAYRETHPRGSRQR